LKFKRVSQEGANAALRANVEAGSRRIRAYTTNHGNTILISEDPVQRELRRVLAAGDDGYRWHMSISHPHRYPTWDEQKEARYELLPRDAYFVSILPPESDYLNHHPNCFHWLELRDGDAVPADR
jgi:hypothetical protein